MPQQRVPTPIVHEVSLFGSAAQQAISDYSRVLQIAPHAHWALVQRAICWKDAKQPSKAAEDEKAAKALEQ